MDIVSDQTRIVQIFLTKGATVGVCEVSVDRATKNLTCTCPGYTGRSTCKHVKFVRARVDGNNGSYPLELAVAVSDEELFEARKTSESFREFVIKHGVIEVL